MMILHLLQPPQADQMFDPDRILRMQALTNSAAPIKSSCHMNACSVRCPWNETMDDMPLVALTQRAIRSSHCLAAESVIVWMLGPDTVL